ncbi:MAG: hypothetical protein R2695_04040 [Acidimicrobiales bacterium]
MTTGAWIAIARIAAITTLVGLDYLRPHLTQLRHRHRRPGARP